MEDLHKVWSHRWVTPKAKCRNSPIQGLGVFAIAPIKKGELIAILGGVIVQKSEIRKYWKIMGHVGIQIADDFFIVPTTRKELEETGVFNHSCEPNIGFVDSTQFVAIKDVKKGEELTFDYAFNETENESFKCECGFKNCRGTITKEDWKIPSIRKKYKKYFSPYLKRKI
jgi:SET domain-containing protein